MTEQTKNIDIYARSLALHAKHKGKLSVECPIPINTMEDLSLVYSPGVAEPCREIQRNPSAIYEVTGKANLVAVITNGSAVLGLGNIGPAASIPVMEGKCALFKRFAGINSIPIVVDARDVETFVDTVARISITFGGINLEDIAAPECFDIERRLQERLDIPVFHDDQHGTAVIALAAFKNALKVVNKKPESVRLVVIGAGAAGTALSRYFIAGGIKNLVVCDKMGILHRDTPNLNASMRQLAEMTNPEGLSGQLADALRGADAVVGVSGPGVITPELVRSMNKDAIIFAMANPTPEIFPDVAIEAGAAIVATGRSDYPNQVNNSLGFPGLFRGALDCRATCINEAMKLAASEALEFLVPENELAKDHIVPYTLDERVVPEVARRVAEAARRTGVARI